MAAITYPASLPCPQRWAGVPRERRGVSPLPGNTQLRNRWRDQVQDIEAAWLYKPAEMETWAEWFKTDLVLGQRWFTVNVLGPGGWIDRVVRFRTGSLRKEWVGLGIWRLTARLEQRGEAVAPTTADPPPPEPGPAILVSSGGGISPTLPPGVVTGSGLVLMVAQRGNYDLTFDAGSWGMQIFQTILSNGAGRIRVFGRVADGTAADGDMDFTMSSGLDSQTAWAVYAVHGVDVSDAAFPATFFVNTDFTQEQVLNTTPINKGATARLSSIVAGLRHTTAGGSITGVPPNYTEDVNQTNLWVSTYQFVTAHREIESGQIEDPGSFPETGGVGGGGHCSCVIGIFYSTPTFDDSEPVDEVDPPAPPVPTPGEYETPRVLGLDYSSDYSDANVAMLAPFPLVLRSMRTGGSTTHGVSYVNKLQAINPDVQVAQYVHINELAYPTSPGADYYPLFLECVANGWYVRSQPGNQLVQWTDAYQNYELNVTDAVTPNGDGQRLAQYKAQEFDFPLRLDKMPEVTWCFVDNFLRQTRVTADYDCDNINDPPAYVGAAWREGYAAYAGALRALRPGLKLIGNVNHNCADPEYVGLLDAGFDEGTIGKTWGRFTNYGITGNWEGKSVRERMLALQENCNGMAIMSAFGTSTDYKRMRFGLTMAMTFGAWFSYIIEGGTLRTCWADEYGQAIGVRTGTIPAAAWSSGVWMQEFENGIVLCNPTATAQTVNPTTLGDFTRFAGSQAPSINSGAAVTGPITIASQDGILLLST